MIPGQVHGATAAERKLGLPCDQIDLGNTVVCNRAVTVAAPPALVFAWLCQLRTAPYSYDWLDNWGRRSPQELDPQPAALAPGQRFMSSFALASWNVNEHLTLRARGLSVTYAVRAAGGGTRLHVRTRAWRGIAPAWVLAPLIIGDYLMARKQLTVLKKLAERDAARVHV